MLTSSSTGGLMASVSRARIVSGVVLGSLALAVSIKTSVGRGSIFRA